jgi:RNA 3'-terminal phosphate cyclase (ATP)
MIEIDGSAGEGGGQILRSALSLAMITGQAFRISQIRAKRSRPGLMRQHLVAVQAAAQVCGAEVEGASLGSLELEFHPGKVRGGEYAFAIGSAGSCTLVLQTLLPALLFADAPSTLNIKGGTHNPMAPPVQFLQRAFLPQLQKMGAQLDLQLLRYGFYPAGGGEIVATVQPCAQLQPLHLQERGERKAAYAESFIASVPFSVARRELECVAAATNWKEDQLLPRELPADQGPGNVLLLTLEHEQVSEVFCAFGEKGVLAEHVARDVVQQYRHYLASQAAVGEHLADQLMLPMALAGGGSMTVTEVSQHARSNAAIIELFLPVRFVFDTGEHGQRIVCTAQ